MDTTLPYSDTDCMRSLTNQANTLLSGRFELLGEVGRGGMGVVYKARHRTLGRLVALKISLPGASTERFLREAQLLAKIQSSHVVAVYDCEILPDGFPMLVMEWVDGTDLQKLMRERQTPLTESEALAWMQQTSAGMWAAAQLGIIHRDFKPSNILIDAHGQARVADFGLARGPDRNDLTHSGLGMMGTPYYMAPEQAENPRGVDTRADIYSFGATFYHALTGKTPFDGETIFTVLFRHKTEPLLPPRSHNPHLSEHLNEFLERCLAKSPNDRFPSFREVHEQLATHGQTSPWDSWTDAGLNKYLERYQQRREVYLHRRDELPEADVYDFSGGRCLKIVVGDMVQQQADALVSSEDGHLSMGEGNPKLGVAAALRLGAGGEYMAEARRFVPVRPGRVVVTSAGKLSAKYVFHGITLEGPVENRVCPSRDLIAEILASCFYHADSLYVRTMAFPLLGTGTGGFSVEVCLDTMFRFLARMLLRGLTTVHEVRLVLRPSNKPASEV